MRATRRGLLVLGTLAALPAVGRAQPPSDGEILEELLVLEHRLEAAYEAALRRNALDPEVARSLRDQEREHVRGLERALLDRDRRARRALVRDPDLKRALRERGGFGGYALELEARALRAYARAAANAQDPRLRRALGAILANEAQHQVALRESLGEPLLGV